MKHSSRVAVTVTDCLRTSKIFSSPAVACKSIAGLAVHFRVGTTGVRRHNIDPAPTPWKRPRNNIDPARTLEVATFPCCNPPSKFVHTSEKPAERPTQASRITVNAAILGVVRISTPLKFISVANEVHSAWACARAIESVRCTQNEHRQGTVLLPLACFFSSYVICFFSSDTLLLLSCSLPALCPYDIIPSTGP